MSNGKRSRPLFNATLRERAERLLERGGFCPEILIQMNKQIALRWDETQPCSLYIKGLPLNRGDCSRPLNEGDILAS